LAGLLAIVWIGAGYVRSNPLALVMVGLIAAFFAMGALELHRYDQDTQALGLALTGLDKVSGHAPDSLLNALNQALAAVPAPLQHGVRQRLEGDRVGLPGPAMTPYLVGFLVLLGMLGTFLGMVVTLSGTGATLERATDLQTLRDSLAAPVKGLGLAFGTSVAGVTTSAMLGLMSALCRRARLQAGQRLDTLAATTLRPLGRAHQRELALALQQQQAQLIPALVAQVEALAAQVQAQATQTHERLLASQAHFHDQAQASYQALAASVDQTLQRSLTESARLAGAAITPVVQATMDGIARETSSLQGQLTQTVQQQLEGLSARFAASTQATTDAWAQALAQQQRSSQAQAQALDTSLQAFGSGFEQRATSLVSSVAASHSALAQQVAGTITDQLTGVASQLDQAVAQVAATWQAALAEQQRSGAQQAQHTQQALATAATQFEQQSAALLKAVDQSHASLQTTLAGRDEQRLAAWSQALTTMAASLQAQWQQAGEQTLQQQAAICSTLEQTAARITAQAEAHAHGTLAEITQLAQTASEAPRAAADLVAQLRDKLSDSMARDTAMLDERSRIMATLNTLLDAVQHASTAQRSAIDQLVASTADWLAQAGARFTEKVDAESARLDSITAQLTGSAVDVASLGEAFGQAVAQFGQSSDKLMGHLQRVDDSLGQAMTRSDEQLAYYVAQAREVIDLSIMSQKQIVEDLQRIATSSAASPAASAASKA
jgi:hypothetical protein